MRPALPVYWIGLHLHKTGVQGPEPLSASVSLRNLRGRGYGCLSVPSPSSPLRWENRSSNTTRGGLVRPRTEGRPPHELLYENANAAWKARWGNTLAWSTMLAVAAHAAAFAFWPDWENSDSFLDPDVELLGTTWMALYAPPSSGGGGRMAVTSLALFVEPDSLPINDVDGGDIIGGPELAQAGLSAGLRERLAGPGSPVPTLVMFSPATGPRAVGDDPGDTREEERDELTVVDEPTVGGEPAVGGKPTVGEPSAGDLALIMEEASPLDLSRLSGVRPQIVVPGISGWILIRNPAEVNRFMSQAASGGASRGEELVHVAVWVDEWGSVEWAEISESSGRQEIDEVALALFNEVASFRPARDQGVRVSAAMVFAVPFPW